MSTDELLSECEVSFAGRVHERHAKAGEATLVVAREGALDLFRSLRDEDRFAFNMLLDITAVDFLGRTPRFDLVYHLYSLQRAHRLRIKIKVAADDAWVPSLIPLWKAAGWLEREVWDMFGIRFDGHPDLRRILLYPSFEGHPLRKDYPVEARQPLVPERDPVADPWRRR